MYTLSSQLDFVPVQALVESRETNEKLSAELAQIKEKEKPEVVEEETTIAPGDFDADEGKVVDSAEGEGDADKDAEETERVFLEVGLIDSSLVVSSDFMFFTYNIQLLAIGGLLSIALGLTVIIIRLSHHNLVFTPNPNPQRSAFPLSRHFSRRRRRTYGCLKRLSS